MTVEGIVDELAADIRARAPTKFSADYSATTDFKIGVLVASWRERGEALKPFAEIPVGVGANNSAAAACIFWTGDPGRDILCGEVRRARAALTGEGLIAELAEGDRPLEPQTEGAGYEP
jgi:hypothetical protein